MSGADWIDYLGLFPDDPFWFDDEGRLSRGEVARLVRQRAGDHATGARVPATFDATRAGLIDWLAALVGGATVVLLPRREPASRRDALARAVADTTGPPGQIWVRTSGTMGRARWLVHTPATMMVAAEAAATRVAFGRGAIWRLSLPLDHVGGLSLVWRALVGGGALAVGTSTPSTHVSLVPTQLHRALAAGDVSDLTDQHCVLLGGAPLPVGLRRRAIAAGVPLYVSYGLTESAALTAVSLPGDPRLLTADYAGRPLWPSRMTVSEAAEIGLAVPSLAIGRADDDGTMTPLDLDGDGWFWTGDLGHRDEDALHVTGRRDNLIISGAEKLAAEELEAALLELPGVLAAVVVPVSDEEFGQRPVAFLETGGSTRWTPASVGESLAGQIARWKLPVAIHELPSGGFKPDRRRLTALAEGQDPGSGII